MGFSRVMIGADGEAYVLADTRHEAEIAYLRYIVGILLEDIDEDDPEDVERVKDELKRLRIEASEEFGELKREREHTLFDELEDRNTRNCWDKMNLYKCDVWLEDLDSELDKSMSRQSKRAERSGMEF